MTNVSTLHSAGDASPSTVGALLSTLSERTLFDLGVGIHESMPQFEGVVRFARHWTSDPRSGGPGTPLHFAVEAIASSLHASTHIDAVVHPVVDGLVHGGVSATEAVDGAAFRDKGVDTIAPIVARGLLIDIPRALGKERVEDGYSVTVDDVESALARQHVSIEPGDVALVRTGKITDFDLGDLYLESQPGVGLDAAVWLADRGVVALGTDTAGTEPLPLADVRRTVHAALLVERGVYLIENLWLEELAARQCYESLFICSPLKMRGATASWVRPIAFASRIATSSVAF
jgi:kynurenine formamidase